MSYRRLPEITEPAEDIETRLRAERDAEKKARLHLLLLVRRKQVTSQGQAAERLALHRNTISLWLGLYREGGLARMLLLGKPGPQIGQRTLPEPVFDRLKARLREPDGFASYGHIQRWLEEEHGFQLPYDTVYTLVRRRLKAKLKVPRPEHPKKKWPTPPTSPNASPVGSTRSLP